MDQRSSGRARSGRQSRCSQLRDPRRGLWRLPVFRQPPPTGDEIGDAFVRNVLDRADAASVALSAADRRVVAEWLGRPPIAGEFEDAVHVGEKAVSDEIPGCAP